MNILEKYKKRSKKYLTVKELFEILRKKAKLSMSLQTLYKLLQDGKIPSEKESGEYRISKDVVNKMLEEIK